MSSRSRPRGSHSHDTDEERRLWKEIKDKAKDVDIKVARSNEIGNQIIETETAQQTLIDGGQPPDSALDERLEKLYRENLKICEDVNHILEGKSNDMNLLDSINILAGLREASEESAAAFSVAAPPERRAAAAGSGKLKKGARATSGGGGSGGASGGTSGGGGGSGGSSGGGGGGGISNVGSTGTGSKGSAAASVAGDDVGGFGDESAAPSPRPAGRLNVPKEKTSRSGSVVTTREPSVKVEDVESVASSNDTSSAAAAPVKQDSVPISSSAGAAAGPMAKTSNRITFKTGEIVFYRHKDKNQEGEGILCRVTSVIGEGKQRRYEVQDVDPGDDRGPIRASVSQLISIPESNKGLADLQKGRAVLAQYPDTTTFYKAEVGIEWKASQLGKSEKGEIVRLRFEGEETPMESEVERRLVLMDK